MKTLTEKMQEASKVAEETEDTDLGDMLTLWGKQIVRAETMDDYRSLPMTQRIVQQLVKFVKNINYKLINDETMPEIKRAQYRTDKQRCMWFIKILSHNYKKDLRLIELAIDNELYELEN